MSRPAHPQTLQHIIGLGRIQEPPLQCGSSASALLFGGLVVAVRKLCSRFALRGRCSGRCRRGKARPRKRCQRHRTPKRPQPLTPSPCSSCLRMGWKGVSFGLLGFSRGRRKDFGLETSWSIAYSGGQVYVNQWAGKSKRKFRL